MSDRIEQIQGRQPLYLRGSDTSSTDTSPSGEFSSPTSSQRLHLRNMSGRDVGIEEEQPLILRTPRANALGDQSGKSPGTPTTPRSFNPEAAAFTPADPSSVESSAKKSIEEQRAERLRQINLIEDFLDREEAMNDFIWEQHTEWSAEDLAKEKEEKELEERRQKYGRYHKDSPK
ncbi:hypothetical protein FSPOR_4250 [Fusarium sporotrichioides]|uniref:Uncharacterized protein n=1 Tax=Fusarium sporotrichioides TaxID=5514 RepID=A0A395SCK3_FUSSP|nr:hypothetical protein FSPOR_4250 [Fusarium sporotrichioides]